MRLKSVKGYEGLYLIGDDGTVISVGRKGATGKELKQALDKNGYMKVSLCKGNVKKTHFIHRLVAENFVVRRYNKNQVNHKDLNKLNNNYSNLEWVTPKENTHHAHANGHNCSAKKRENDWHAKLSKEQVVEIYNLKGTDSGISVAKRYSMSPTSIYSIWNGTRWNWLTK